MTTRDDAASSVLIVDDEPGIVDVLRTYLEDEGFRVAVAFDGENALRIFRCQALDLILLDLSLPTMSGVEVMRAIRADSDVPVIMCTSRANPVDSVVGLELGADDFIVKPFSPRDVVARVKAVLRRTHGRRWANAGVVRFGDIEFDRIGREVRRGGEPVYVTPTEFRILKTLIENAGRTFTRAQLLAAITADQLELNDRTLDGNIADVREKLEDDPAQPKHIITVFGVGYQFILN